MPCKVGIPWLGRCVAVHATVEDQLPSGARHRSATGGVPMTFRFRVREKPPLKYVVRIDRSLMSLPPSSRTSSMRENASGLSCRTSGSASGFCPWLAAIGRSACRIADSSPPFPGARYRMVVSKTPSRVRRGCCPCSSSNSSATDSPGGETRSRREGASRGAARSRRRGTRGVHLARGEVQRVFHRHQPQIGSAVISRGAYRPLEILAVRETSGDGAWLGRPDAAAQRRHVDHGLAWFQERGTDGGMFGPRYRAVTVRLLSRSLVT